MQFSVFHQFLTQANIQMQKAGAEAWFYAEISSRFWSGALSAISPQLPETEQRLGLYSVPCVESAYALTIPEWLSEGLRVKG